VITSTMMNLRVIEKQVSGLRSQESFVALAKT